MLGIREKTGFAGIISGGGGLVVKFLYRIFPEVLLTKPFTCTIEAYFEIFFFFGTNMFKDSKYMVLDPQKTNC